METIEIIDEILYFFYFACIVLKYVHTENKENSIEEFVYNYQNK